MMQRGSTARLVLLSATLAATLGLAGTAGAVAQSAPATKPADAPAPAEPQKVDGSAPAWTVTCVSRGRAAQADCTMEQRLFNSDNGQLMSVAVVSVPGESRKPELVLQLPTGLTLTEPVTLAVDDGTPVPVTVRSCDGRGCFAALPLGNDLLKAMRAGKVMSVRAVAGNGAVLTFPHMLIDFTAAFDAVK
ncbi:invasion associated locus B family protein [uncultured Tistrella sp.]|uniref:invasion associated locus B family protein n=1 Tax=Tistrella mobilis TaxID=171437 RepID=UPI000C0B9FBF|nr:invasion associated locus B family protein [uncultured Tistrella sp.]MAM75446.1 Invasion protein B-like protein [Tistrella sp.]